MISGKCGGSEEKENAEVKRNRPEVTPEIIDKELRAISIETREERDLNPMDLCGSVNVRTTDKHRLPLFIPDASITWLEARHPDLARLRKERRVKDLSLRGPKHRGRVHIIRPLIV